jgi:hypothetical protein
MTVSERARLVALKLGNLQREARDFAKCDPATSTNQPYRLESLALAAADYTAAIAACMDPRHNKRRR